MGLWAMEEKEENLFGEDNLSYPRNIACELSYAKMRKIYFYMKQKNVHNLLLVLP